MQLISLWVKDFKNLKDFTINFENQENLSIIIGNNGSGKSNILEAISAIFNLVYGKNYTHKFHFKLKYKIKDQKITIDCSDRHNFYTKYFVDNIEKSRVYLKNNSLIPSRIVALYSGEEMRLYKNYYEGFTKKYLRDFSQILSPSNNMIYIDKSYWSIALLVLIISAKDGNEDHQQFLENNLGIKKVKNIHIDFKTSYFPRIHDKSQLDILLQVINPQQLSSIDYTDDKLFLLLKGAYNNINTEELFNILIHASLLQRSKVFESITFTINDENIGLNDLSEGEKKKLLIKATMDFVANENSLILLDEPDSHIHVEGKQEIFNIFKEYASTYNRSFVITTHSPTLTNCADDKHIVMLTRNDNGNCEIVDTDRKECINRLTNGLWTADETHIFFASNKPLVLVEGKGDVAYIKSAMKILNYYLDINILPVGGATNAKCFIDEIKQEVKDRTVIMLFDRDGEGVNGLKDCINQGTRGRPDMNVYKIANIYYLMLPKLPVHTEIDFLIEDYLPIDLKKTIAHNITDQGQGFFNKYVKDLKEKLKIELAKPDHLTIENYEGFRVLLEKIKEIINGTNIQNLVEIR